MNNIYVEQISSDIDVAKVWHLTCTQATLLVGFLGIFTYATLLLTIHDIDYYHNGIAYVGGGLLLLGFIGQSVSYCIYRKQTVLCNVRGATGDINTSLMGKPEIRELFTGLFLSAIAVVYTLLVLLVFARPWESPDWDDKTTDTPRSVRVQAYVSNLYSACALGTVVVTRSLITHWMPIATVTQWADSKKQ